MRVPPRQLSPMEHMLAQRPQVTGIASLATTLYGDLANLRKVRYFSCKGSVMRLSCGIARSGTLPPS